MYIYNIYIYIIYYILYIIYYILYIIYYILYIIYYILYIIYCILYIIYILYIYIPDESTRGFLHLVDTHFPAGHKLHKIFTVKVSYSCMNNVRSIITNHNTHIIRKSQTQMTSVDSCNCRNKEACPLQDKCMNKDIVYKATISTSNANDTKHYIGMTSSTFK